MKKYKVEIMKSKNKERYYIIVWITEGTYFFNKISRKVAFELMNIFKQKEIKIEEI